MKASAQNELYSIKVELRYIIAELESIEQGIRCDFEGIGNDICADRLKLLLENKLYSARNALNNVDTSRVAEEYKVKHSVRNK